MKEIFIIILAIFLFSCATTKKEVRLPQPQPQIQTLISVSDLLPYDKAEQRIKALTELINKAELSEQEKRDIEEIIDTYNLIKTMALKGYMAQDEVKKLISSLFDVFSLMEKRYTANIQKGPPKVSKIRVSKIIERLDQEKERIIRDYKQGKYTDVVNECLELKLKYGPSVMGTDLEIIFAISLGEIGMLDEAIKIGERVSQKIANLPNYAVLKEKMEEWQKIIKEAELPKKEEKPEAHEEKEERIDINILIANVKRLIEQENFEQALNILNEVRIDNEKIQRLKDKAIEGIINRERNKAAKFFLLAKKFKDLEKKKEYLESAYRILEALIMQYPDYPLIDRIKANLDKVSEELKSISTLPSPISP